MGIRARASAWTGWCSRCAAPASLRWRWTRLRPTSCAARRRWRACPRTLTGAPSPTWLTISSAGKSDCWPLSPAGLVRPVPPPDLSIIIVSWNVRERLRACLSSLPAPGSGLETIVVDAASADGTPEMVRAEFPAVQLIAQPDNVGYSRGNNLGLAQARGRYAMILNPDTELDEHTLPVLTNYLDGHPLVGLVGPRLVLPDGTVQASRRRFPTLGTAAFESTWLAGLAPRRVLERYFAADLPADQPAEVDWLVRAALL